MRVRVIVVLLCAAVVGGFKLVNRIGHQRALVFFAGSAPLSLTVAANDGAPVPLELKPFSVTHLPVGRGHVEIASAASAGEPYRASADVGFSDWTVAVPTSADQCFVMLDFSSCYGGGSRDHCTPTVHKKYDAHAPVGLSENVVFSEHELPNVAVTKRSERVVASVLRSVPCTSLAKADAALADEALEADVPPALSQNVRDEMTALKHELAAMKTPAPSCATGPLMPRLVGCFGPVVAARYAAFPVRELTTEQQDLVKSLSSVAAATPSEKERVAVGLDVKKRFIARAATDLKQLAAKEQGAKARRLRDLATSLEHVKLDDRLALSMFFYDHIQKNKDLEVFWVHDFGVLEGAVDTAAEAGFRADYVGETLGNALAQWDNARAPETRMALFE